MLNEIGEVVSEEWGKLLHSLKDIIALADITPKPLSQIDVVIDWIQRQMFRSDFGFCVIIHDNDPDGHAANAILRSCLPLGRGVVSVPVTHGKPFNDYMETIESKFRAGGEFYGASAVVVLDHAVSAMGAMNLLTAMGRGELLIIDHHPETVDMESVAIEDLTVLKDTHWSTAGLCQLVYSKIYASSMPMGMQQITTHPVTPAEIMGLLVSYYDTWKFGQTTNADGENAARAIGAIAFHDGFETVPWCSIANTNSTAMFYASNEEGKRLLLDVIHRGKALLDIKAQVAYKVVTKSLNKRLICLPTANDPETMGRAKVGVLFHSDDIDNVAAAALKLHEDLDLVAMIYLKADGGTPFKMAIRGRSGSTLTARDVAKHFGGGGHPCSAGAQISDISDFFKHTHAIES